MPEKSVRIKEKPNTLRNFRRSAKALGRIIGENSAVRVTPISKNLGLSALREIVRLRKVQAEAAQLGLLESEHDTTEELKGKIWSSLPEKLAEKGVTKGAVIQKNYGSNRSDPHLVLEELIEGRSTLLLNLRKRGTPKEYYAVDIAINATLYETEPES